MAPNAVAWFAIPVSDLERARHFYSTILDIEMADLVTPGGTCAVFPQMGTGVSGSLNPFMGFPPSSEAGVTIWLAAGDDLQEPLSRVEDAGGQVLQPKQSLGEFGNVAMLLDTEGNRIGLHSPN
jgi:hypothetical protein